MKFVDLFAGLGGFHQGLIATGSFECVFAAEINKDLRELYMSNFGIMPEGDVTQIDAARIPAHDLLCAGFPCQPFSRAGKKKGAKCPKSGALIKDIVRIAKYHQPRFLLLENVPNILTIEDGEFWRGVVQEINEIGYQVDVRIMNPLQFGIPQSRERLYALCYKDCSNEIYKFGWPAFSASPPPTPSEFFGSNSDYKMLEDCKVKQLNHWQSFLNSAKIDCMKQMSIVAPEFGATYPVDFSTLSLSQMRKYKGAYGQSLKTCNDWSEIQNFLPRYIRSTGVPNWLLPSVKWSRKIYSANTTYCDSWQQDLDKRFNSWQLLEWRGYSDKSLVSDHIIQFRASGIRILKNDKMPSLISMTPTQIPVIGSEMRYLSKYEGAQLQHLHTLPKLPDSATKAFKALGNAVNAKIIELIGNELLKFA